MRVFAPVDSAQIRCNDGSMSDQWPLGTRLASARRAAGIKSARAAARIAGFDEAIWRRLESGTVSVAGVVAPYTPTDETVWRAARAVGLDAAELFALLDRPYDPAAWPEVEEPAPEEADRLSAIERELRRQAEGLARIEEHLGIGDEP